MSDPRPDVHVNGFTLLHNVRACTQFWRTGHCARGTTCRFAHVTIPNARKQCQFLEGACRIEGCELFHAPKSKNICHRYVLGRCDRGNNCIYTHDVFATKLPLFDGKTEVKVVDVCSYHAYDIQHIPEKDRTQWLLKRSMPYYTRDGRTFYTKLQGEDVLFTNWIVLCARFDYRGTVQNVDNITVELLMTTHFGRKYKAWLEERREKLEREREKTPSPSPYTSSMYAVVDAEQSPFLMDLPWSGN